MPAWLSAPVLWFVAALLLLVTVALGVSLAITAVLLGALAVTQYSDAGSAAAIVT